MQFFTDFPYTNTGDINLDWLIEQVKNLDARVTALESRVTSLEEALNNE